MEPITISHGLLKHEFRRLPIAMRILGYIYHGCASRKAQKIDLNVDYNEAPNDLPPGVATVSNVLQPKKGVTWHTYMLNEYRMQIAFILSASGFISCRIRASSGSFTTRRPSTMLCFTPTSLS